MDTDLESDTGLQDVELFHYFNTRPYSQILNYLTHDKRELQDCANIRLQTGTECKASVAEMLSGGHLTNHECATKQTLY